MPPHFQDLCKIKTHRPYFLNLMSSGRVFMLLGNWEVSKSTSFLWATISSYFSFIFPVIYYYALAIEMFLIGVFAHYSFRRVEPSMEAQQVIHHQASQIQEGPSGRGSPAEGVSVEGTNPGYLCDEAFCTIEHSPLDRFDFIGKEPGNRQQQNWGLGCQRGEALKTEGLRLSLQQPGTEVSSEIQIQSHVSRMEANGASAV